MTARHDKATEGRTEAAAVDQAIADVREALNKPWCPNLGSCPPELHSGCSYCADHEDALAALRVLADAVEELREKNARERKARKAVEGVRAEEVVAARTNLAARAEAAEAENVRLARQVADLEAALRKIEAGLGYPILYREVARAALAARSRDPQESQT